MSDEAVAGGRIVGILKEKKSLWLIGAALIIGICLMLFGGGDADGAAVVSANVSEYADAGDLEARVKNLCERVSGISNASVMITLDTYGEQMYAFNAQQSYDGENKNERFEYVTTSGGLVPTGEVMPRVRGIAVVCSGGDEPGIKLKLTEMLCALFSIPSSSVSIVGAK